MPLLFPASTNAQIRLDSVCEFRVSFRSEIGSEPGMGRLGHVDFKALAIHSAPTEGPGSHLPTLNYLLLGHVEGDWHFFVPCG